MNRAGEPLRFGGKNGLARCHNVGDDHSPSPIPVATRAAEETVIAENHNSPIFPSVLSFPRTLYRYHGPFRLCFFGLLEGRVVTMVKVSLVAWRFG